MIRLFLQIDVELTQEEGLYIATMTNQLKGNNNILSLPDTPPPAVTHSLPDKPSPSLTLPSPSLTHLSLPALPEP